jgi:hypothetical protein
VQRAPGIPCALYRAEEFQRLGRDARRGCESVFDAFDRAIRSTVIVREGGRSSIPETSAKKPRSRGVLDAPPSRGMTIEWGATPSTSLRAKRSNPFFLYAARWIASLRSQ